jgi:hypothetical protein
MKGSEMNWKPALIAVLATSLLAGCGPSVPAPKVLPLEPTSAATASSSATGETCLASGDQDTINARLQGPGAVAVLCPGAVFELTAPVTFTADRQEIYTENLPADDTRAILRIVSPNLATAVLMRDHNNALLSNVIVDGNRGKLGPKSGDALIYAGGYSDGQTIRNNKIMDPRSWSALQLIQGFSESMPCKNALVENNEIGPAGTSLDWADGVSFACTNSTVLENVITDATDGGIVVFGAPGSVIESNKVRAQTRTLLGGINMVDYEAYDGNFTGTVVKDNIIEASGAVIRIGLAMGDRVWVCLPSNSPEHTLIGGTVTGNTLRGDKMQYGYTVDGVREWTVTGNIDEAKHSGKPSQDCNGRVASSPAGFLYNPARAKGVFQPEFAQGQLDLALWAIVAPRPGE